MYENICTEIKELLRNTKKEFDGITVLCIGTDRSTGDSFGPLVGYMLKDLKCCTVKGDIENPVHAKNIKDIVKLIPDSHLVIAVDASLGEIEDVEKINVRLGGIKPGSISSKDLPIVGHISITGVVNFSGFMEFLILQNTRLAVVMKMAKIASKALKQALEEYTEEKFKRQPESTGIAI